MLYHRHIWEVFCMEYRKKRSGKERSLPISIFGGILGGFCMGVMLVLCCSLIAFRTANPSSWVLPTGLCCLVIAAIFCGFLSAKLWGHKSLVPSLISGAIFGVLIISFGLCIPGSTLPLAVRISGMPIILILSLLGGGITMRKKVHRRPR